MAVLTQKTALCKAVAKKSLPIKMPPEPFRVRSLPIGYGIFISARLLVRLIILYNAPFVQTKRQKFAASARYVKNRGNADTSPDAAANPEPTVRLQTFGWQLNPRPTPVPARRAAPCSRYTYRPPSGPTAARPRPCSLQGAAVSGRAAPNRRAA